MSKHPYKQTGNHRIRRIDEHRWVMEQKIGRRLGRLEFVHHINGDKRNNRIENLKIVTPKEHAIEHGQWKHKEIKKCEWCGNDFKPSPTKRDRAKTCCKICRYALSARTNLSRKSRLNSSEQQRNVNE